MCDTKADFKKYLKFFCSRMVQQLVQARLGDPIEQPCVATPESHDWFNMKIDELGEVSAFLKNSVRHLPPVGKLTVEFVLYTASGQFLPLETWSLTVDETAVANSNLRTDLYHQLSTLLRSVTCAARMTPMHRLYVRKQNIDSFIIMYRIYDCTGISDLGKEAKHRKLATLPTPFGTIYLDLIYRTEMHFDKPEMHIESDEEEDPDKTLENDKTPTPSLPNRPSLANCIPLNANTAKGEKIVTTPMSANTCNFQANSDGSKKNGPKFILGQSTSSEESRNSEQPLDEDEKPPIALLKKNSFPFLSLLTSSYAPKEKKNSAACLTSRIPETLSEADLINKDSDDKPKENEEDDDEDVTKSLEGSSMAQSEESFVDLDICAFGTKASQIGHELGELIKQLKIAPDILTNCAFPPVIAGGQIENDLRKLTAQENEINAFMQRINSITDND